MIVRVANHTIGPEHFEREYPLQERIKKAPKRVVQQIAYTRLMEDRMSDLEKRLQKIDNQGIELESTPPARKTTQPPNFIMDIKRMTFQEYLPAIQNPGNPGLKVIATFAPAEHKRRYEFPGQLPYHLIDVVVSATHQPERLTKDQSIKPAAGPRDLAASSNFIPTQALTTYEGPRGSSFSLNAFASTQHCCLRL